MKKRIKERQLLKPVCRLFPKLVPVTEFPFKGKLIDVLFIKRKTGKGNLIAIELKIKKWKKAMRQAAVYQLFAHKVYIALPNDRLNDRVLETVTNQGIGVISIDLEKKLLKAKIVRRPKPTNFLNKKYTEEVLDLIKKSKYVGVG